MTDAEIQKQVADNILERGIKIKLPAPFLLRIIGIKEVSRVITSPKLGTLIAMSRVSSDLNVQLDKLLEGSIGYATELAENYGEYVAEWIAIAILNDKREIDKHAKKLARKLLWFYTPKQLGEAFMLIVLLSGVEHFTNTIRFMDGMNLLKKNLSQEINGS